MKHIPELNIKIIPSKKQRYETCGDYFPAKGIWNFRISKCNPDYEFTILVHEIVEWYITQKRGITEKSVSKFDIDFNKKGLEGEPGDHKNSPYRNEHKFATKIEKILCKELGINWNKYNSFGFNYD